MQRLDFVQNHISKKEIIYSVPVGQVRKGETRILRHPLSVNGLLTIPSHIKNLADFWDDIVKNHSNNFAFQQTTYREVDQLSKSIGSWLVENKHTKIFLYAKNCAQWTITDIACWNYGTIGIPLYDTLGSEAFFHIIKLTQGTIIFTTNDLTNNLFANLSKNKEKINTVIYFDNVNQQNRKKFQGLGMKVLNFKNLLDTKISKRPTMTLNQHLTYSFTSGTTGLPKGVIGTHQAAISQCLAMGGRIQLGPNDVHLSFLPIAHTFQRFVTWMILYFGANIKYSRFPISQLVKDLARAKPTFLPMVPRLLNRFYPLCKGLYEKQKNNIKIKQIFGGKVRIMVTGSAPISPEILIFFKDVLEWDVRQGYGQTQTTAASTGTDEGDSTFGHVGGPYRVAQLKLIDVPEMNYLTSDNPPKGQICLRGPIVFKEYYLDEKNTRQAIDKQGWNHSGDIGLILPNGALKIIDRKKNIFKLSQGEYIAPQKIQNAYSRCPYVAECFLYGDSLQSFNVAIVHPNLEVLPVIANKLKIEQKSIQKLVKNKIIEEFILKEMTEHGKKQGLFGFELAKKVRLWPASFATLGLFTSTMKLQRHIAKQKFKNEIQAMYKQ